MSFLSPVEGIGILMFVLMIMGLSLLPKIFFLLTLHRTFEEISPENRFMQPGEVWLLLIPFFRYDLDILRSAKNVGFASKEFDKRNIQCNELRPAYNIGITYAILKACTVIPFLGFLSFLGTMVCWIIYWINVNDYKNLILRNPLNSN